MVTFGIEIYEALFEPLPQAVLVLDGRRIAFVNTAAARLLGGDDAGLVGASIDRVLDAPAALVTQLTSRRSESFSTPTVMLRSDGSRREVDVEASPLDLGLAPLVRLTISEPARTATTPNPEGDRRMRTAESELRAIFRALPDHFLRLDAHGTILEYHAPDRAAPFMPPMQFIGRRMHEMLPLEAAESLSEAIESAHDAGRVRTVEYALPLAGNTHYFEARIVPYSADRLIAMVRDVTDRKRAEAELLLGHKLESIERLAGGMAHDFNNLLTAIVAHAELASMEAGVASPLSRHLQPILAAAERAADLTRKLLSFSRNHVGSVARVEVRDVIRQFVRTVEVSLGEDVALEIKLDTDSTPLPVIADPALLEKALFNLVVNSREAMPNGGRLTISARRVLIGPVFASKHFGLKHGDYAAIYVHDTGDGMDEATLKRAFDPFFSTRRQAEGRGLGLPTTHGIVRQLGGHVLAMSRPGRGTLLAIYLPLATIEGATDHPSDGEITRARSRHVLVVEDEPTVREVVSRALTKHGFIVATSENGSEALDRVQRNGFDFDMLITDVVMPKMGGRELVQHLRREKPALKVLYISGYTASALDPKDLAEPGTAFLQKPFTPAALAQEVGRLIAI